MDALGRLERAKELLDDNLPRQALELLRVPVPPLLADEKDFLAAEGLRAEGYFTLAAKRYELVLRRVRPAQDPELWVDSCLGFVRVMRSLGETAAARRRWDEAAKAVKKLKLSQYADSLLLEKALLDRADGFYEKALVPLQKLLGKFHKEKDWSGAGFLLWAIGGARRFMGDLAGAERDFLAGLAAFKRAGDKAGMGYALFGLGGVSRILGKLKQSRDYYAAAGERFKHTQDIFGQAYAHCGLANVLRQQGLLDQARAHYLKSWALYSKLDDRVDLAYVDWGLGKIALQKGELKEAEKLLRRALKAFAKSNETRGVVLSEMSLSGVLHSLGRTAAAESYFNSACARARKARTYTHLEIFT